MAAWREYLRHRSEDFRGFSTEIPVVVRGGADEERNRLAWMTTAVLAEHELRPSTTLEAADEEDSAPVLEINGETIVRGLPTLNGLKRVVHQRLSDW